MKKTMVLTILFVAAFLVGTACKKQDVAKDKAALEELVRADNEHFPAGTTGDSVGNLVDDTTVVFWWRGAQTHDSAPGLAVEVVGDSGWVEWSQHNYGDVFIWAKTDSTHAERWTKDLVETVKLAAIFKREGQTSDNDRGWKLKQISLASGRSDSTHTVNIDSMRIQSSIRNYLFVDPLASFFRIDSLFSLTPGENVTITLYTNATSGRAFLHTFIAVWPFYVRPEFDYQGDGVFSGTWHAQYIQGFKFAIFDLMSTTTLSTPDQPYDFNGWLLPYTIKTAE
jgi:hypothetical protein